VDDPASLAHEDPCGTHTHEVSLQDDHLVIDRVSRSVTPYRPLQAHPDRPWTETLTAYVHAWCALHR
jgi:hypothetical protein